MRILKIIFLLSILLSLALFINTTDIGKAVSSLHLVGAKFMILLLTTFMAYLSASIGWKYCLGGEGKRTSLTNLFFIRHIGETVSLINPAGIIGGEAVKVFLLHKKGFEKKKVITSILISRILMAATQILLFFVTAMLITTGHAGIEFHFPSFNTLFIPLIAASFSVFVIVKYRHHLVNLVNDTKLYQIVKKRFVHWRIRLKELGQEISFFFANNKKALAWSILFFMFHWLLGSLEFFFILKFLGIKITLVQSLFLDMGVVLFKSAGAFVPGQLGVEEYGNKIMLSLIGVAGAEIWITVSLLKRLRQLCWIALGLCFYLWINKKNSNALIIPDGNIVCQS